MIFVTIWWVVSAHKWFKGPKVNIEHMMLGRHEAVVEGHDVSLTRTKDSMSSDANAPEKILKS